MNKQEQGLFFNKIIEENGGILKKVARTYCPCSEDRQDLLQEMMIQIWQAVPRYDAQYKISTWLYRISLNVAISHYRKSSSRTKHQAILDEPSYPADENQTKEMHWNLLEQFINELPELDKALMLLYLEDKSHSDMGEIMGLSVSNVGTRISRIKEKLRIRFSKIKN